MTKERKEILDNLESTFTDLAYEYHNETENYERLKHLQDRFYLYLRLVAEELEGVEYLEEFCNSYM